MAQNKLQLESVECIDTNELRFQGNKTYILDRLGYVGTSTGSGISLDDLIEIIKFGRQQLQGDALKLLNHVAANYKL